MAVIVAKSEGARAGRPHSRSPPSWTGKLSWNQPTPFVSERAFLLALCGGPPLEPATPPPSFFKSVPPTSRDPQRATTSLFSFYSIRSHQTHSVERTQERH